MLRFNNMSKQSHRTSEARAGYVALAEVELFVYGTVRDEFSPEA